MAHASSSPHAGDEERALDLDALLKYSAVLAAITYSTGVVAINTYLHQLGITDFSFAKPKLLLTGILVLASFLCLAAPLFFLLVRLVGKALPGWEDLPSVRELLYPAIGFGVLLLAASAYSCFGTETVPSEANPAAPVSEPAIGQVTVWWMWEHLKPHDAWHKSLSSLLVTAELYLPALLAAWFAVQAARLLVRKASAGCTRRVNIDCFHLAVALIALSVSMIAYIYFFALTFYPVVPQAFGGGQPYYESFSIDPSQRATLEQMGIPFLSEHDTLTEPLPVLHESDSMVAVWFKVSSTASGASGESAAHAPCAASSAAEEGDLPGTLHRVVVQIDKKQINATLQYPSDTAPPTLRRPQEPCPAH